MNYVTKAPSVGEIAARSLAAVRILEEHGIDYCCGGQRSVADVCSEKGIDSDVLLKQVQAAERNPTDAGRNWRAATLAELIDHILSTHHEYLRRELPLIENRLIAVLNAHSEAHGQLLRQLSVLFAGLKTELQVHMQKEESVLFPFVRAAEMSASAGRGLPHSPFGTVRNPIRMMEHEHDSAGDALAAMRRLTNNYELPEGACNTWRALYGGLAELESDLHLHIHLENNILFPRAIALELGTIPADAASH
jgi:regulator of cell morphogenesis and NO signaling